MNEMHSRRFIPSLSQLIAFDAVVRTRSVTGAAKELNLTQSTVSRLIQNLEGQLGRRLFLRQRKRLVPTGAAETYFRDISNAISLIRRASMGVVANPEGGILSLAVLPTFGTRWLGPRLGNFLKMNPGVTVNLATRTQRFDFNTEMFDAAIFFGESDWPQARHLKLFEEHLTACASPEFLGRHPVHDPSGMTDLPLLQLETRPTAWTTWFERQGTVQPITSGMLMDQFSMMIQAAISGLGVALLPDYLAWPEIEEGRLAPILRSSVPGTGCYWLAWSEHRDRYSPLLAFRDWLESLDMP